MISRSGYSGPKSPGNGGGLRQGQRPNPCLAVDYQRLLITLSEIS